MRPVDAEAVHIGEFGTSDRRQGRRRCGRAVVVAARVKLNAMTAPEAN